MGPQAFGPRACGSPRRSTKNQGEPVLWTCSLLGEKQTTPHNQVNRELKAPVPAEPREKNPSVCTGMDVCRGQPPCGADLVFQAGYGGKSVYPEL